MCCNISDTCKKYQNGTCDYPNFCIRKFKIDKFYELAGLTPKMMEKISVQMDLEDLESESRLKEVQADIENFIRTGGNLYIYSTITGNGKTAWAVNLIKSYINRVWHSHELSTIALFVNIPRYLISVKDSFDSKNDYANHIKETVMDCPVVVWDDIATKDMTEFERETILSILDYRFNANLSNIFTSNADPSELYGSIGKRLSSRIVGNTEKIRFTGKDKRTSR